MSDFPIFQDFSTKNLIKNANNVGMMEFITSFIPMKTGIQKLRRQENSIKNLNSVRMAELTGMTTEIGTREFAEGMKENKTQYSKNNPEIYQSFSNKAFHFKKEDFLLC